MKTAISKLSPVNLQKPPKHTSDKQTNNRQKRSSMVIFDSNETVSLNTNGCKANSR